MRIIVTDEGRYWNHENPILEKYAECVLVVCLNGKRVTDKYECFVSPYKQVGMGVGDSIFGAKYQALKSVEKELRCTYSYHDDILFLADCEAQSLYPYLVLKDNEEYNKLHLWCMSPWKVESYRRKREYFELLNDLTKLQSVLYVDSNVLMSMVDENASFLELNQFCFEYFSKLLPNVICDIGTRMKWGKHYYYDLGVNRYIEIENSFDAYLAAKPLSENDVEQFQPHMSYSTLGLIRYKMYPSDDEDTKETVRQGLPRIDGKKICEELKKMRKSLAEANDIAYEVIDCPSTGPCAGTCPQCDKEILELQAELTKIPEEHRQYPKFEIEPGELGMSPVAVDMKELESREILIMGRISPIWEVEDNE